MKARWWVKNSIDAFVLAELERRGHKIEITTVRPSSKIYAAHLLPDGRMEAARDPRGSGLGGVVLPRVESW